MTARNAFIDERLKSPTHAAYSYSPFTWSDFCPGQRWAQFVYELRTLDLEAQLEFDGCGGLKMLRQDNRVFMAFTDLVLLSQREARTQLHISRVIALTNGFKEDYAEDASWRLVPYGELK